MQKIHIPTQWCCGVFWVFFKETKSLITLAKISVFVKGNVTDLTSNILIWGKGKPIFKDGGEGVKNKKFPMRERIYFFKQLSS